MGTDRLWRELTSDIGSLAWRFLVLQQVVADEKVNGNDVVLVGGQGGVFRRIADGSWHEYGAGLPNALTTVLERCSAAPTTCCCKAPSGAAHGRWTP